MKILITGVAGFIGSNLAERLLALGHSVVGFDNLSQGSLRNLKPFDGDPRFRLQIGDVRDLAAVETLVADTDCVVHLAAFKIPRYGNAMDTMVVNTHGGRNVLKAAAARGVRVVFASTSDVYGRNPVVPFGEGSDLWIGPSHVRRWAYAVSKLYDEHLSFAYHHERGLPIVVVRLFGGYGPRQNPTWWGGPQSVFIDAAVRGEPMEIHGDGQQTRSFTYVTDHVDGFVRCIERPEAIGQVFNIGSTEEITIQDLALTIWRLAGSGPPKLKVIPYEAFGSYQDVRRRVPELGKAASVLGFTPSVKLEDGLQRTIAWHLAEYREQSK